MFQGMEHFVKVSRLLTSGLGVQGCSGAFQGVPVLFRFV